MVPNCHMWKHPNRENCPKTELIIIDYKYDHEQDPSIIIERFFGTFHTDSLLLECGFGPIN